MPDWVMRILGVDAEGIPADAQTDFVLRHAPESWQAFVVIALLGLGLVMIFRWYRSEKVTCSQGWRITLACLRTAAVLLLALVMLGPALNVLVTKTLEPHGVLLVDESLSQGLEDRYQQEGARKAATALLGGDEHLADVEDGVERMRLMKAVLERDDAAFVTELRRKGQLHVLGYGDQVKEHAILERLQADDAVQEDAATKVPLPDFQAQAPSSRLAKGLREALKTVSGHPAAGIVLLSDGQAVNEEAVLAAADLAAKKQVPIYAIGFGESELPPNRRVVEAWAPERVFRDDPFILQARVEARGENVDELTVELVERLAEADEESGSVVATQRPKADKGDIASVRFEHTPATTGDYVYTIRVSVGDEEQMVDDNRRSLPVKVLSEQARVLMISGSPTWEYRMVKTLLSRDKTIDVSCWLQTMDLEMRQDGNTVIDRLPKDAEDWLVYDVIMLFDPNPNEFDVDWTTLMEKYLGEHGGGLLWMAGPKFTSTFFTQLRTRSILDLLPIQASGGQSVSRELLSLAYTREWPLRLTPDGIDHALFRLHEDPQINRRLAERLPGIYWTYPVYGAKPATQVLLEHTDPRLRRKGQGRPLLVTGRYGPGRTVFMGFDGTWRWRKYGERYFDRWWVQMVRYLIEGRLQGGRTRGRLATDRDRYAVGDRIAVTAKLFDAQFEPLEQDLVNARIENGRAEPRLLELRPVPGRPGEYGGSLVAAQLGVNELQVELPGEADTAAIALNQRFTVEVPQVEFADPRLNRRLLSEIADRTGGRYVDFDQAADIPGLLPEKTEQVVIPGRPVELWDTNRLLILITLLLGLEWGIRKYFKML